VILLILASQVARMTGVRHLHWLLPLIIPVTWRLLAFSKEAKTEQESEEARDMEDTQEEASECQLSFSLYLKPTYLPTCLYSFPHCIINT
jgi:hypothetical protein